MKVLLTGADGQVGHALRASAPTWAELQLSTQDVLDISDRNAVERIVGKLDPDVIISTAAYTDVEKAEVEPETARAVNTIGAENLAIAAQNCNSRLCHISTDYVFDTDRALPIEPGHPCNPANVYGHTKRDGEIRVLDVLGDSCLVIRTSWLYYEGGHNFVETMLRLMAGDDSIRVVADQFGAPTWAATLANAIWSAVRLEIGGLHHWRDAGIASWYDFAVAIAEIAQEVGRLDKTPDILPVTSREYRTAARRPVFSLLDTRITEAEFGIRSQHWRLELTRMLEQLSNV